MALLTKKSRASKFKYLNLGAYNQKNILAFQKKAFPNHKEEWDGKWGSHSDNALRTFYNVKRYAPNFKPAEFRCNCGHCCGYPTYMKKTELQHLQTIRRHYDKPMEITSGLRCTYENERVGGIPNSGHLTGYAADFSMKGVTDSVTSRKKTLKYLMSLPDHQFSYGANMVDSNGLYRTASGMGDAMHTETHAPTADIHDKICQTAKGIAESGDYTYVYYDAKYGHECAICHPHGGKNKGWQCIGYAIACWFHGGVSCKCGCDVLTNQIYDDMLNSLSMKEVLRKAQDRLGTKDLKVIRNKKGIPSKKIQKGDLVIFYKGRKYVHTTLGVENHKLADCTSGRVPHIKYGVKVYTKWTPKLIIRYTGK